MKCCYIYTDTLISPQNTVPKVLGIIKMFPGRCERSFVYFTWPAVVLAFTPPTEEHLGQLAYLFLNPEHGPLHPCSNISRFTTGPITALTGKVS